MSLPTSDSFCLIASHINKSKLVWRKKGNEAMDHEMYLQSGVKAPEDIGEETIGKSQRRINIRLNLDG